MPFILVIDTDISEKSLLKKIKKNILNQIGRKILVRRKRQKKVYLFKQIMMKKNFWYWTRKQILNNLAIKLFINIIVKLFIQFIKLIK